MAERTVTTADDIRRRFENLHPLVRTLVEMLIPLPPGSSPAEDPLGWALFALSVTPAGRLSGAVRRVLPALRKFRNTTNRAIKGLKQLTEDSEFTRRVIEGWPTPSAFASVLDKRQDIQKAIRNVEEAGEELLGVPLRLPKATDSTPYELIDTLEGLRNVPPQVAYIARRSASRGGLREVRLMGSWELGAPGVLGSTLPDGTILLYTGEIRRAALTESRSRDVIDRWIRSRLRQAGVRASQALPADTLTHELTHVATVLDLLNARVPTEMMIGDMSGELVRLFGQSRAGQQIARPVVERLAQGLAEVSGSPLEQALMKVSPSRNVLTDRLMHMLSEGVGSREWEALQETLANISTAAFKPVAGVQPAERRLARNLLTRALPMGPFSPPAYSVYTVAEVPAVLSEVLFPSQPTLRAFGNFIEMQRREQAEPLRRLIDTLQGLYGDIGGPTTLR